MSLLNRVLMISLALTAMNCIGMTENVQNLIIKPGLLSTWVRRSLINVPIWISIGIVYQTEYPQLKMEEPKENNGKIRGP
jgi:hypothetical protein